MSADARGVRSRRGLWVALLIAVVVVTALVVTSRVQAQREHDTRVDVYFCTMSGVGPFDRGPKTGRTCVDLLSD